MRRFSCIVAICFLIAVPDVPIAGAEKAVDRFDLMGIFEDEAVAGTFVLIDVHADTMTVVDGARARQRFSPASTFKFANSLLALEHGAVSDENEIIPHGGEPRRFAAWEKDMTIGEAFAVSNLPVFQEIARRLGRAVYAADLPGFSYGNGVVGADVRRFWLDGSLRISAVEQARFMAALAQRRLPVSERTLEIVHRISRLERRGDAVLHGKTGWTEAEEPPLGWFVGWVETPNRVYAFALNMNMTVEDPGPSRRRLAKRFLRALNVY